MKKFKLIRKYPGSDSLGTIITGTKETMYSKGFGYRNYDWTHVETHPEYWEEVIEKDYEIISYEAKDNPKMITIKRREAHLHEEYWKIHSVKRLSDGEIFTVGDRAMTEGSRGGHSIRQFRIKQMCNVRTPIPGIFAKDGIDRIWIDWEEGCGGNWLESTVKLKQPIFLTHDGEDIFEGDTVWYVNKESYSYSCFEAYSGIKFHSNLNAYFLTKEAAESYLIDNKPCLSFRDCCEVFERVSITRGSALMEKVKQKLGMK